MFGHISLRFFLQNILNLSASIGNPLEMIINIMCKSSQSHFSIPKILAKVSRYLSVSTVRAVLPSFEVPETGRTTSTSNPICCRISDCIFFFRSSTKCHYADFLEILHFCTWFLYPRRNKNSKTRIQACSGLIPYTRDPGSSGMLESYEVFEV